MNRPARRCLTALCILGLLLAQAAWAQGLRYRVEVEAPRAFEKTLKQGLSLTRWQGDAKMTPQQLRRLAEEAVREATQVAATEGYFSPQVDVRIDETEPEWRVAVSVDPGPRTRVAAVDIRFSGPATQDPEAAALFKRVREGWRLRQGEPFRQADWDAAKREAARTLARWRYAGARVADSQASINPETREASLTLELASGPAFRFGSVRVSGMRRYPDAIAENLSPIRTGETYDRDQVLLYQRRLLETGYFASVQAELDTHPLLADEAPLRVAVIEASSQHIETGIGYTTDAGPRFELTYTNQDVFDSAWRFKSSLRADEKQQQLQLDFDSPPRAKARWNTFTTRARQEDIQNELTRELAFGMRYNFGLLSAPQALITSLHFEEQRIEGQPTDNLQALYLGYRRNFRETDDLVLPRSGYLALAEIGGALPGLATREFLRVLASASLLMRLGRNDDLLLRGEVGLVFADAREGIPSTFLFRTGGDQTVRGYEYQSLGLRKGTAVVGGRRLAVGAIEYTHWFGESWGLAAFTDAGNAWDTGLRFEPVFGYGFGVRFRTPIGPIRADLAYGEDTSQIRLHFSVGYTF